MDSYTFTDRVKQPWYKKINPIWWFQNDTEQTVDQASWYHPDWPEWRRKLMWEFRNPLQNFRAFVVGVQDKNYTVYGKAPVLTVQRNDLAPPEDGVQYCFVMGFLPFWSYCKGRFVFYIGWQPTG